MGSPTISSHKILAATRGNPDLLEVLQSIQGVSNQQQAVTGTTPSVAPAPGQPNPAAPVPPQATGSASLLGSAYIVQIVNPGGMSPISQIQSQQQTANATPLTPLQPVKVIFHQIRASTSPAFNVNSNTQTFGGNTGSAQVYWTLTGLGSGTWYFQFRSSYDGINFNTWKNVNGGTALGGLINQVTTETVGDATWALFAMPGGLVMGVGAAELVDGSFFNLPAQVYSSGMMALAGPNGFSGQGNGVSGFTLSDVDVQTGSGTVVGIPDFPVVVRMQMAIASTMTTFPADASVLAIAFDPTNPQVTIYKSSKATWAVFQLPGGARFAVGQGKNLDGETIDTPAAVTWLDPSRMFSVGSLTDAVLNRPPVTGVNQAQLTALVATASYLNDAGASVPGQTLNWMAIAWQDGASILTAGGHSFLEIQLQSGHAVIFGAGQTASGTPIVLPAGYGVDRMLSIATPAGCANSGHHMRGVQTCAMFGLTPTLTYTDNASNVWDGLVGWMIACWK